MSRRTWVGATWVVLTLLAGCAGGGGVEKGVPVEGTVTLDGQPLPGATVLFRPEGQTGGHGGRGTTDAAGRFQTTGPQGSKGLVPGTYRVVISRRLNPDGSAPPPNEKPIESQARETLPDRYSQARASELTFVLAPGEKKPADFALVSRP